MIIVIVADYFAIAMDFYDDDSLLDGTSLTLLRTESGRCATIFKVNKVPA